MKIKKTLMIFLYIVLGIIFMWALILFVLWYSGKKIRLVSFWPFILLNEEAIDNRPWWNFWGDPALDYGGGRFRGGKGADGEY